MIEPWLRVVLFIIVVVLLGWRNTRRKCLPKSMRGRKHDDWGFPPLTWIPRGWTVVCGSSWPEPPKKWLGDSGWNRGHANELQHHLPHDIARYGNVLPIPRPHHWVLSSVAWWGILPIFPYLAITFTKWHFRIGLMRWDDVDHYYQIWTIAFHTLDVERKNLT